MQSLNDKTERFIIGKHTYYAKDLQLRTWEPDEKIIIGKYCSIADKVIICTGGQHRRDLVSTFPFDVLIQKSDGPKSLTYQNTKNTEIKNDVWIGTGAMILGGVQIGSGAVIGAGAVVSQDVPDYAVVGGNPAQVLRYRFSKGLVEELLELAWWEWEEQFLKDNITWFYKPVVEFVNHFKKIRKTCPT